MTTHLERQPERSRVFARDIEPDPGYEFRVIDPGEEIAIEPGTWTELVPIDDLEAIAKLLGDGRIRWEPNYPEVERALKIAMGVDHGA